MSVTTIIKASVEVKYNVEVKNNRLKSKPMFFQEFF